MVSLTADPMFARSGGSEPMIDSAAGAPASPMPAPMSRFLADLGFKTPPEVDELAKQSFFVQSARSSSGSWTRTWC